MKKVTNKQTKKLTLGKMTLAKLQMREHQMQRIYGGEATKPTDKPVNSKGDGLLGDCLFTTTRTQV